MEITAEQLKEVIKDIISEYESQKKEKLTLNIIEASKVAGVNEDKIRQLVHTTDFPCFKNGNKWLINREMLNEWLKKVSSEHRKI